MNDIDMELLEDLIAKCEAKMASPFKKAKPQPKEEEPKLELEEVPSEEKEPEEDESDIQDLLELYNKLKD